jgi:hypothetical protein
MSTFYREVRAAAVLARANNEAKCEARVASKSFWDAFEALIKKVANNGEFTCFAQESDALKGTSTVRLSPQLLDRQSVIEVPADLAEALASRLEKLFGFTVSPYVTRVKRVSWEVDELVSV